MQPLFSTNGLAWRSDLESQLRSMGSELYVGIYPEGGVSPGICGAHAEARCSETPSQTTGKVAGSGGLGTAQWPPP